MVDNSKKKCATCGSGKPSTTRNGVVEYREDIHKAYRPDLTDEAD